MCKKTKRYVALMLCVLIFVLNCICSFADMSGQTVYSGDLDVSIQKTINGKLVGNHSVDLYDSYVGSSSIASPLTDELIVADIPIATTVSVNSSGTAPIFSAYNNYTFSIENLRDYFVASIANSNTTLLTDAYFNLFADKVNSVYVYLYDKNMNVVGSYLSEFNISYTVSSYMPPKYNVTINIPYQKSDVYHLSFVINTNVSDYGHWSSDYACHTPCIDYAKNFAMYGFSWHVGFENAKVYVTNEGSVAVQEQLNEIKNNNTNFFGSVLNYFKSLISNISDLPVSLWNNFSSVLNTISNSVSGLANGVWDKFSSILTTMSNSLSGLANGIWSKFSSVLTSISTSTSNMATNVGNVISTAFNSVGDKVVSAVNGIKNTPAQLWNTFNDGLQTLFVPDDDVITSGVDRLKDKFPLVDSVVDFAHLINEKFNYDSNSFEPILTVDIPKNEKSFYLRGEHSRF